MPSNSTGALEDVFDLPRGEGNRVAGFGVYVQHTEANPTYQVVAGAVGLLVFLNVVNQLVLFAAALTATSHAGQASDLADRATRTAGDPGSPSPQLPPSPPVGG